MADDSVTIIGVAKLRRLFRILARDIVSDQVLDDIGHYLTFSIETRTLSGREIEGQPFKPYSPAYAAFREREGLQSDTPDLSFTGSMLNALTYRVESAREQVRVFFMEGTDKTGMSNPAKAFYLQDERPFFGASLEDIEKINAIYQDHVEELLRGR